MARSMERATEDGHQGHQEKEVSTMIRHWLRRLRKSVSPEPSRLYRPLTPAEPVPTADDIINGYGQVIERAHEHGIRVIMGTLTPFADALVGTPLSGYYTPEKDAIRRQVNAWIRTNRTADGLIDLDKILEDPRSPGHLRRIFACADHLHPNDAGYQAMANSVNLDLLVPAK